MLPLVFLSDIVLNFVLFVRVILGGFPHFNGYHHWHQSCGAGNPSECWLVRIRWHLKVASRDKAQTKQSAQKFALHTNAALAGWTSNELQITNKVTGSLSLASSAEDKESLQGVAEKNTGRGRKSVPLKQIKGKERLVVSGVTLKGFDEQQLPKDGINYLLQAWTNWLLCKHQCTDSVSDVILIHIRTVIYSSSPSQPHSFSPLTSTNFCLHSGFLTHLWHFSLFWPSPSITSEYSHSFQPSLSCPLLLVMLSLESFLCQRQDHSYPRYLSSSLGL